MSAEPEEQPNTDVARFVERLREPGTSFISPERLSEALGIEMAGVAVLAGLDGEALGNSGSERLQIRLCEMVRVIAAATTLTAGRRRGDQNLRALIGPIMWPCARASKRVCASSSSGPAIHFNRSAQAVWRLGTTKSFSRLSHEAAAIRRACCRQPLPRWAVICDA